jgi:hypothetical protein
MINQDSSTRVPIRDYNNTTFAKPSIPKGNSTRNTRMFYSERPSLAGFIPEQVNSYLNKKPTRLSPSPSNPLRIDPVNIGPNSVRLGYQSGNNSPNRNKNDHMKSQGVLKNNQ